MKERRKKAWRKASRVSHNVVGWQIRNNSYSRSTPTLIHTLEYRGSREERGEKSVRVHHHTSSLASRRPHGGAAPQREGEGERGRERG
eukprot:scaffold18209_cov33-Tisochrysis_lutea.AAC.5